MKDTTFNARRAQRDAKSGTKPGARFPILTTLTAHVLDVTASFPDGSIEVLARIGQSDSLIAPANTVTLRLTRAEATGAGIIEEV